MDGVFKGKLLNLLERLQSCGVVVRYPYWINNDDETIGIENIDFSEHDKEFLEEIDRLKAENSKIHREIQKTTITDNLPYEPIAVAEFLINKIEKYEHNSFMKAFTENEQGTYNIYGISELRQIAEHLLVYCNNNKDEG